MNLFYYSIDQHYINIFHDIFNNNNDSYRDIFNANDST